MQLLLLVPSVAFCSGLWTVFSEDFEGFGVFFNYLVVEEDTHPWMLSRLHSTLLSYHFKCS